jgi:hypothetical protein
MKATLETINQMQADGAIAHYAIGGEVGVTYYLEPAATLDIDIFVILPFVPGGPRNSVDPLYEYLRARGCTGQGEHIVIGGWPVRFVVPRNELDRDAVVGSIPVILDDIRTWVMMSEHLVAIALHSGIPKDHARILRFIESDAIDGSTLQAVLKQHGLTDNKWKEFQGRFVETFPSKQQCRKRSTAPSFSEKVKILEKLRDQSLGVAAASGLRQQTADPQVP